MSTGRAGKRGGGGSGADPHGDQAALENTGTVSITSCSYRESLRL